VSDPHAAAQSFYGRWARLYDVLARRTPGIRALRRRAVRALGPEPGDLVVDLGCGTGANLRHLRDRVGTDGTVVGVDFTPGVLARARRHVARRGWENVHLVRGDAARPPLARADGVLASFLVGMLGDPAAAVGTWADLVGPGGRLALLDLARSTGAGRPLNPAFRGLVWLSAPPGAGDGRGESPTARLDRRVAAAHRALLSRCDPATHETRALGFARLSAGRV